MKMLVISFLSIFFVCSLLAQDEKAVVGKIESATIFRLGTELTHVAKPALSLGNNDLIIEGLSSSINTNSLKINCSGGVTIMGSEFFKDYLSSSKPSLTSTQKLQDSISFYNKELKRLEVILETNKELQTLLQENKSIGGTQTGVTVTELMRMMDYYKSKSIELETEKSNAEETITRYKNRIAVLKAQLDQESGKNNKVSGKLRLKLIAPLTGTYDLEISYYTSAAYWMPYYDLQVESSDKPVKMICKAKFMQTTGIDWSKVSLTLSTSTPSNGKTAPVFNAWFLSSRQNISMKAMEVLDEKAVVQNSISYSKSKESVVRLRGTSTFDSGNNPIYVVNGQIMSSEDFEKIDPNMIERVDFLKDTSSTAVYGSRAANGVFQVTLKSTFVTESVNEIDMTYKIDLPYNLLSTGKEQSVTLRTLELPATYEYYCAPKLDKATYLLAGIKDWSKYNLLGGEASITYAGTYIGKSMIDPNSTQEVLHLTLGDDKRIVVKREKMQDYTSSKFLGNDKEQQFAYQLTVKNNKNTSVNMILKDQFPISTDKSIVVKVIETDGAHVNEEIGTLTWEFPLKPGETKVYKIKYSVKYPKDMNLGI